MLSQIGMQKKKEGVKVEGIVREDETNHENGERNKNIPGSDETQSTVYACMKTL